MVTFIALWAVNVWLLDKLRMPYTFVLNVKQSKLYVTPSIPTHVDLTLFFAVTVSISFVLGVCGILIALYSTIMTVSISGFGFTIETGIMLFYTTLFAAQFLPWTFGAEHQRAFYRLFRMVLMPGHTITFPEVLLADALCSVSKLLKDFGTTAVVIYAAFQRQDVIVYHDSAMIIVALFASIPFW